MNAKKPWAVLNATNGAAFAIYLLACIGIGIACVGLINGAVSFSRWYHSTPANHTDEKGTK